MHGAEVPEMRCCDDAGIGESQKYKGALSYVAIKTYKYKISAVRRRSWGKAKKRKGGCTMPRGDGTGPRGMGPMSGRGAGYCAGYDMPGFGNQVPGRGFGMGVGRGAGFSGGGRGWRNCFYATGLPGWAVLAVTGMPAFRRRP